jgi:hypothetical protein
MLKDLHKNSKKTSIGFHTLVPNWLSTGHYKHDLTLRPRTHNLSEGEICLFLNIKPFTQVAVNKYPTDAYFRLQR